MAFHGAQFGQLLGGFNAFGNDHNIEVVRYGDYGAHDFLIFGIVHFGDKGTIDFQGVEIEPMQMRQRRVAGAEVVEAELNSQRLQAVDHFFCRIRVGQQRLLSHLQAQVPR